MLLTKCDYYLLIPKLNDELYEKGIHNSKTLLMDGNICSLQALNKIVLYNQISNCKNMFIHFLQNEV